MATTETADPTVNQATGKQCKGARAAQALHAILNNPTVLTALRRSNPELAREAMASVAPFTPKWGPIVEGRAKVLAAHVTLGDLVDYMLGRACGTATELVLAAHFGCSVEQAHRIIIMAESTRGAGFTVRPGGRFSGTTLVFSETDCEVL